MYYKIIKAIENKNNITDNTMQFIETAVEKHTTYRRIRTNGHTCITEETINIIKRKIVYPKN